MSQQKKTKTKIQYGRVKGEFLKCEIRLFEYELIVQIINALIDSWLRNISVKQKKFPFFLFKCQLPQQERAVFLVFKYKSLLKSE